jgi:hypothetical protein
MSQEIANLAVESLQDLARKESAAVTGEGQNAQGRKTHSGCVYRIAEFPFRDARLLFIDLRLFLMCVRFELDFGNL